MRQKVRRFSKSAISVLLSVMMVASLVTVGIVNTSAYTFTTNHKIYFDATKWTSRSKVYVNFLNDGKTSGNLQEMTQIGSTGIYRYENSSVFGDNNYGVMFVTNDGWNTAGDWHANNSYNNIKTYASNCTKYYGLNLEQEHVYYFRASGANKDDGLFLDKDYNDYQKTINHDTVRNTDRVWAFNLTATSSVADTEAGTPATGNASSSAGGKITVNASYFNGWDSVSDTGDCADSSTTTTYSNAAKGCTATWKVKQVYSGYEFDGWYSDASSTGTNNRLSIDQNYTETVTGDFNGTITRYAHFHRAKSTVNTAVSPSGAGTAYISNSSTIGTDTSVSNITDGETVYLKATANTGYTFSKWRTASGLNYDNANDASTTATVTANATATAEFTANTYTITKQNPDHAKIKAPAEAATGSKVTPSATTDAGWKVTKYKYSTDGTTWTEVTPGSSFTMPASNVTVTAVVEECSTYTVTLNTDGGGQGSVLARTSEGQTISSGDVVNEGTVITFTASAAENNAFGGWSGTGSASSFSGTDASETATITEDTTVTASFSENVVQVAYYGTSDTNTGTTPSATYSMTLLDSGYYRSSTKLNNGACFTVKKTVGDVTTYAKSGASGTTWYINSGSPVVTPQHWTSDDTINKKYKNATGSASYVFYDPAQNKIWLSTSADGLTGVTIYAKDGSFTGKTPGANPPTSAGWGSTTLKVSTDGGLTWSNGTDVFDGNAQTATLTSAQVDSASTKIKVSTTVSESDYYVYGYDINGCITKTATDKGSNTYELEFSPSDVETNLAGYIEITPIYMLIDPSTSNPGVATNTIRFYVRGFAGDVEARWGGELYCYAYKDTTTITNGNWPGQPMINLGGGTYYMDLPINTKAITLSNAAADWIHAKTLGINLSGTEQETWDRRNEYQCQTYDYDDFQYIYAKPGVGANDEDIIFDFRYKHGEWGISGKDNFNLLTSSSNETSFPDTLTPGEYSGWEKYTDFYDEPIDLWGTKLTGNFDNNPVRVVVQGYYDTTAANSSFYATTYVVYKPESFTGSPGTYSLVNYTNSSEGYGKKSRSEFLQRSAEEMGLTSLAGQPVQITYEYAIYKNMSTKGSHPLNQTNQFAERADGVWYYSETKPVKGKVLIQYADNMRSAFSDDTFAIDEDNPGTDYDGDDYTVNEGTVTKAKAYFVDNNYGRSPRTLSRPTNAPFNVDYDGRTVEWAYSDGYDYYDVKAEDPADGEYTFVGWYKLSSSGIALATTDYTYSFEATTNETFIARYVKVPSGVVKLAHKPVVTGNSGGNGDRKVWYDIVDSNNTSVLPSGTTQEANGQITVPKTYVKYGKNYTLQVKFQVTPDSNSLKHGIYSTNEAATANLLNKSNLEGHNHSINVENFTLSPSGTTATVDTDYVTFSIPMDRFFKLVEGTGTGGIPAEYEFDTDKSLIEVFSDFDRIKNNINITKSVDYNNGETFKFSVEEEYVPNPDTPEVTDWRNYNGYYTVGEGTTQTAFNGIIQNISGGQIFHILDVPAGVKLRIVEVENTNTNYVCEGVTSFSGNATSVATYGNGKSFVMDNNGDVDMTFTNTIKRQNFTITKKIDVASNSAGTFSFMVNLNGSAIPNTYQYKIGDGTAQNFSGGVATMTGSVSGTTMTVLNIPVGASIEVYESNSGAGYDLNNVVFTAGGSVGNAAVDANKHATFTVTDGTTHALEFTNYKKQTVTIKKELIAGDSDVDDPATAFKFKITVDGQAYTSQVQRGGETYNPVNGVYELHINQTMELSNIARGAVVNVVEVDHLDNYYAYDSSTVDGATKQTPDAIDGSTDGAKFTVGSETVAVVVKNRARRVNVVINKKTDFPVDDESEFVIDVKSRQRNSQNNNPVANSSGVVSSGSTNNNDGTYNLKKDGTITFTDVPKGTYFIVNETSQGTYAPISGPRFTKQSIHAYPTSTASNPEYIQVRDDSENLTDELTARSVPMTVNTTFVVSNIVKRNDLIIAKTITDATDHNAEHLLTVVLKQSATGDPYTGLTYQYKRHDDTDWSAAQSFTSGGTIKIHQDEQIKFSGVPVGTYVSIQETAPSGNYIYTLDTFTVDNYIANSLAVNSVNKTVSFVTADVSGATNVIITNKLQRFNLEVTKATDSSVADTFKVKAQISTAQAGTYNDMTFTAAGQFSISGLDDTTAFGNYDSYTHEITLTKGQTLTVKNLAINSFVKVVESNSGTYHEWQNYTAATGTTIKNSPASAADGAIVQMTADQALTINNKIKTHNVVITKSINNSDNSTATFPISVSIKPLGTGEAQTTWERKIANGTQESDSLTGMEITNGQSITIYNVPVDAQVTVSEGATANFTAVSVDGTSGSTATFTMPDADKNVPVINSINNKTVTVKKVVTGEAANTDTFPIQVEVKNNTSGATFAPYTGTGFTDGKIMLAANNTTGATVTVPLDAEVKVTELNSSTDGMPAGYTIDKITKNSDTADVRTGQTGYTYTYSDQANGTVTVHNKRVQGSIKVTKKISGDKYGDPDFAITVTYKLPTDSDTTTETFTVKGNGASSPLYELPYNTTVTAVTEATVAGYKLIDTNPIQYKVNDGAVQNFGSGFTVTDQPVEIIVTNELTKHTVTVEKQVVNASDIPIADSTDFTVSYQNGSAAAQTGTITKGSNTITVSDVPYGTTFQVSEPAANIPRGYALKNISDGTTTSETTYSGTITGNTNITVTNTKLPTYDVTITKQADGTPGNKQFGITVSTASEITYSYSVNSAAAQSFTGTSKEYMLQSGQNVVLSGLLAGDVLNIQETTVGEDYTFEKFVVNGTDNTDATITYTVNSTDNNIVVHNKEAAKYQYEIKYIYESYSAKTYQNNTNLTDANRVVGEDRSYTQTGEISTDDLNTYFDKAVDGSLSFKSVVLRKNFISKFAPYEDDFMLSLVWDDQNPSDATYFPDTKTIKLETRASSQLDRTVNVKFKLPYVSDSNLVPDANATYLDELYQKPLTTKYGNHVTNSSGNYVTAPLTLDKNGTTMYFQYWQIKSDHQNKDTDFTEADSKRCYYASFNMTMYQDSYVEAIYTEAQTDYNPSSVSYADTVNGEARINYIETSRNQWNSNGGNSTDGAKKYAGDRVYVDFLLTFGYKDLELSTLNNTDLKTGFVLEQVAELDIEDGKYVTKKESEYAAMYEGTPADKATRETKVKAYINDKTNSTYADDLGTHTFKMDSTIALTTLDNKNQCKHSVDMASKTLNTDGTTLKESTLKNYVYRAYSYVKLADGTIQLSAPVYFTIYDVATIANGTNQ